MYIDIYTYMYIFLAELCMYIYIYAKPPQDWLSGPQASVKSPEQHQ